MNGMWNTATSRPATYAPKPAIEYWASDSWPAYPVSTTIDSRTMATPSETVSASVHFDALVTMMNTTAPQPNSVHAQLIRPLPTIGSCSR